MRVQQGPYIGEVAKDGSYVIKKEGQDVESGTASTMKEGFDRMEAWIEQSCKKDLAAGRQFVPGLKPFLVR